MKYGDRFYDPAAALNAIEEYDSRFIEVGNDAALFLRMYGEVWEAHYAYTARGKYALDVSNTILEKMFSLGAKIIIGYIPVVNRKAILWTRKLGFNSLGRIDRPEGEQELLILRREDFNGITIRGQ